MGTTTSTTIILDTRKLLADVFPETSARKIATHLNTWMRSMGQPPKFDISFKAVEKWRARSIIRSDWLVRLFVYARDIAGKKLKIHDYILVKQEVKSRA